MNPITVDELWEDWTDAPYLSDEDKQALSQLPDSTLREALDEAFTRHESMWLHVLDATRTDATRALLHRQSD